MPGSPASVIERLTQIEQLLPAVAAERHPSACEAANTLVRLPMTDVAQAVVGHRALGATTRLAEAAGGAELVNLLRGYERGAVIRHLGKLRTLRDLAGLLDGIGTPWLTFKGPVLAEHVYRDGNRGYSDLDVLVPPGWFARVVELLVDEGARVYDRNWPMVRRDLRAQLHLVLPDGTALDLHWHMVNLRSIRRTFRITGDALHDRARTVSVGGLEVPTLGAEDAIVQLALHASISGGHELVWLKDLEQAVLHDTPAWESVVDIARAQRTTVALAASLSRASHTLAFALPPGLLRDLAPGPGARRVVRTATTWRARGRLPGGGSVDRAVLRSLRGSRAATAAALVQSAGAMMQRQFDKHQYWLDPDDPRNVRFDDGGDAGRNAYLAEVAQTVARRPPTV